MPKFGTNSYTSWRAPQFLDQPSDIAQLTYQDAEFLTSALYHAAQYYDEGAQMARPRDKRTSDQLELQSEQAKELADRIEDAYLVIYDKIDYHDAAE
jgi:hypothetical protein